MFWQYFLKFQLYSHMSTAKNFHSTRKRTKDMLLAKVRVKYTQTNALLLAKVYNTEYTNQGYSSSQGKVNTNQCFASIATKKYT